MEYNKEIPLICFILCIYARLSYFTSNNYIYKYNEIFNKIIPKTIQKNICNIEINNIFNNDLILKNIKNFDILKYSEKINKTLNNKIIDNSKFDNVKYISISTSNYSTVYITANKIMNSIIVSFRGTSSPKSFESYFKPSSLKPEKICNGNDSGFNYGIYKITNEIINTIMESILYLAETFLISKNEKIKIFSTGHSLGVMSMIFAFNWIGMRNNIDSIYSKEPYNILDNKICCVTFGSPRVLNLEAKKIFNNMVKKKLIYFRRIHNYNDLIVDLPPSTKKNLISYYHPSESKINNQHNNHVNNNIFINYKENNKFLFNKYGLDAHSLYLFILFENEESLTNPYKEIKRFDIAKKNYSKIAGGNTVCRIILFENDVFRSGFFLLDDAKYESLYNKKIINPYSQLDIQDIYMTNKNFNKIIINMKSMNNKNPLKGDIIELNKDYKKQSINCYTINLINSK